MNSEFNLGMRKKLKKDVDIGYIDTLIKRISINLDIKKIGFVSGVLLSIPCGILAKFYFITTTSEAISISAYILVLFTLWYHASNLSVNITVNSKKIFYDKKSLSINIITEWYRDFSKHSAKVRVFRTSYIKKNDSGIIDEQALIKDIDSSSNEELPIRVDIIPILNYFEKIAISIEHDVSDEEILRDYFEDIFIKYYDFFQPLIKARRNETVGGMPSAFNHFSSLVEKWKDN